MANLWSAPRTLSAWAEVVAALVALEDWLRRVSGLYVQPRTVTTATTLLVSDRLLICDTTGGAFTVTLLSAKLYPPQPYWVKLLAGANNVTLSSPENIYTTVGATTLAFNTVGMTKVIWPFETSSKGTWAWVEVGS
jgi:hypothetical protein